MTAVRADIPGSLQAVPVRAVSNNRRQSARHRAVKARSSLPRPSHRAIAFEACLKLACNGVVAAAAIAALVRLVPYREAQLSQLEKLNTAVVLADAEATELRQNFSRYFDPAQASHVMQEQSGRDALNQKTVVLIEPTY